MKHILVVVDIQKDFVDGTLGSQNAVAITKPAAERIRNFDGDIFVTYDTHYENYLETAEGKKLPVEHCIENTAGWQLDSNIEEALKGKKFTKVIKNTFGSKDLPQLIEKSAKGQDFDILIFGLCTDICVVSNALYLKANFPEKEITVDSACCAGVTPQTHQAALETMKCCQINVL